MKEWNTTNIDDMTHCGLRPVFMPNGTCKTLLLNCLLDRGTCAHEDQRGLEVLLANPATPIFWNRHCTPSRWAEAIGYSTGRRFVPNSPVSAVARSSLSGAMQRTSRCVSNVFVWTLTCQQRHPTTPGGWGYCSKTVV